MTKSVKAVTIGDIDGIGIKLLINIWKYKRKKVGVFVLISNFKLFKKYINDNNIQVPYLRITDFSNTYKIFNSYLPIFDIKADNNILNSYNSIKSGYYLNKKNLCNALITLPINKEKIIKKIDSKFIGQTEFLQKLDKKQYSNMIFFSKNVIITTLTTHIPLKNINYYLKNKTLIYKKIYSINKILKTNFNIKKPKIAISGLNPHAGESGSFGNEEIKFLKPVINKLIKKGINIQGPFSPDTIFNPLNRLKYNCFICIYHDQGLIPFKLISPFEGVHVTGSLDIIRTSPTHGTAYNLVKTNKANNKSLINSFIIAEKIYKNRLRNKIVTT